MSHTKGNWDRRTIFDEQDNFFADTETSTKTYEEEYANARRLVACWNLLLPFTTEEIEAGIDLEKLVRENVALKAENERLRKDAERLAWMEAHPRLGQIHVDGEVKDCYLYAISGALGVPLRAIIDAAMQEVK